jgi:hypothetical protein
MLNPVGDFRPLEKIQLSAHISEPSSRYSTLTESVVKMIGKSREVAIYGYRDLGYSFVYEQLKQEIKERRSPLAGCYNWETLNEGPYFRATGSLQGKISHQTPYKAGLLNVVLENCKRSRIGNPIITVLFCVVSSCWAHRFSPLSANSRCRTSKGIQRRATASELNFVYKLCYDPRLSKEIHQVARRTFIFVETVGPILDKPTALKDTGLKIDHTWDRVLKKEHKVSVSSESEWRAWILDSLFRETYLDLEIPVGHLIKIFSVDNLRNLKTL